MYNVTLRRIPVTIVEVENNKYYIFLVYVCSLWYSACNAHKPYFHVWPASLYKIFPQYLINGMIFEKKELLNIKHFFTSLLKIFLF